METIPPFSDVLNELRADHGAPNERIVSVTGFTGAGSSTIAELIAEEYDLEWIHAGQFFRDAAKEHGLSLKAFESAAPKIEKREGIDFDRQWDRTALEYAFTKEDFVLEGRLAGPLLCGIAPVRILVTCDPETVAERIADREGLSVDAAQEYVETRNREALKRYEHKYGIDPRKTKYYNLVIDNSDPLDIVRERVLAGVAALSPLFDR